ncbi:hypothetical protein C8034_v000331 [Colletotrichum sidae]|uniref:Uncharacterized protein n=1 Tax=Colletotrichum sidae TaxID=1347389 RepID=A0A4R8TGW9_9PEZI|nr:hypothetical protein C8034_v000331 [Colletotrichum sidae]
MGSTGAFGTLTKTHTYSVGNGFKKSIIYTLPPQTTPFTPPDSICTQFPKAIRCEGKPEEQDPNSPCWALQYVESTGTSLPSQCFPTSYVEIYRPVDDFDDVMSLAYPGTACISGWTTACTTKLERSSDNFVQTWCCPPGGWTCFTDPGSQAPARGCVTTITAPTDAWFANVITTGRSDSTIKNSWRKVPSTDLPSRGIIMLQHPVLALDGRLNETNSESESLSGGAIAGLVVGMVVLLGLIGGGGFLWLRHRSRAREAAISEAGQGNHDGKTEPPGYVVAEMHGVQSAPLELSSCTRATEVTADSRPVELAS